MFSIVVGARPNFMKIAPLVRAMRHAEVAWRIIHTGQHYDERMSQTFFDELHIPQPDVNLYVGSGTHVYQISEVMRRLEVEFEQNRPEAVIVVGDVNSTLAAALCASKLSIPVAHVEAGLRSYDRSMPEETNRVVTDALADWLFASEPAAVENLRREGVAAERIHLVGNVMIDTLLSHVDCARALKCPEKLGLEPGRYTVLTLHRPSNVDDPHRLESILRAVRRIGADLPVVFPVHPRTEMRIREFGLEELTAPPECLAIKPQGYLDMLGLVASARLVLTDSGGLQEETTALKIPCLTLRENTERPITVELGSNRLVGWRTEDILAAARQILDGPRHQGTVPPTWDGHASRRIVDVLLRGRGTAGQRENFAAATAR
ncbi:MAG TPA: UDP-N-acetylglucosamine 2-epimerase (non-hydrolyzing) [Planctomycetaceae bacterium]|nr:UDP-N-acetylglucosamine 2-epimerase (non-hydrolyzing) [Planctomycetaceae bacterium]